MVFFSFLDHGCNYISIYYIIGNSELGEIEEKNNLPI